MCQFRFSKIFSEGMIAKANSPFKVWGFGNCEKVKFSLISQNNIFSVEARNENGMFFAEFPMQKPSFDSYTLQAVCSDCVVEITSINFGYVYLTIGQSNMSYALGSIEKADEILERASNCKNIKVFDIFEKECESTEEIVRPVYPNLDFKYSEYYWKSGNDLKNVSAISVIIATVIAEKLNAPVGIIHASMGGLSIESYLPREVIDNDDEEVKFLKKVGRYTSVENYNNNGVRNFTQLSGVYNEKIAPLFDYSLSGIIWYLGESSVWDFEFANHYQKQLKMLIDNYRNKFGQIPFVSIEIAPQTYSYGDGNGYNYINEAMQELYKNVENYFVVPTYDIEPRWLIEDGDLYFHPIHPVNKYMVGERVANALLTQKREFPRISKVTYKEKQAICEVIDGYGLKISQELFGFTVKDINGKYYQAKAQVIDRDKILVTNDNIEKICGITYAFFQYQEYCDAKDVKGNPLLQYRSDFEPVSDNYFSNPPYLTCEQEYILENCFGYEVGITNKFDAWTSGTIYTDKVKISYDSKNKTVGKKSLKITCYPKNRYYFYFGVSPTICISGRKHHLDNYNYLTLDIKSTNNCEFWGIVVRLVNGAVRRFCVVDDIGRKNNIPLNDKFNKYCVDLNNWLTEDSGVCEATKQLRQNICQIQFLFRSKENTIINIDNICLLDKKPNVKYKSFDTKKSGRADIVLPS